MGRAKSDIGKKSVVFIGREDFANVGAVFCKCLEEVGVNACVFSQYPTMRPITSDIYGDESSFAFGDTTGLVDPRKFELVRTEMRKADAIVWLQSDHYANVDAMANLCPLNPGLTPLKSFARNKRVAVFHGGTRYRRNYKKKNIEFNRMVNVTLIQTYDMWELKAPRAKAAVNKVWMLPAAYIGDIEPDLTVHDKLVVGHFPSSTSNKGSDLINGVMARYTDKVDYRYAESVGVNRLEWEDNLERMNECDIYIESLNWSAPSRNKHDWSVAALEAAALGDIVITNFHFGARQYEIEYGHCALHIANSEGELIAVMDKLLKMDKETLLDLKWRALDWAETIHGLKPIGRRLKRVLGI